MGSLNKSPLRKLVRIRDIYTRRSILITEQGTTGKDRLHSLEKSLGTQNYTLNNKIKIWSGNAKADPLKICSEQ